MANEAEPLQGLIKQMHKMLGYVPVGTRDLLHILAHPDMIELTKRYIEGQEIRGYEEEVYGNGATDDGRGESAGAS